MQKKVTPPMKTQALVLGMMAMAATAMAGEKDNQLHSQFVVRCMGVPHLTQMAKTAQAMTLQEIRTEGEIKAEGHYTKMQSWLLTGDSQGPFMWIGNEAFGPNGFVTDCGVSGFGVDVASIKTLMKLEGEGVVVKDGPMTISSWPDKTEAEKSYRIIDGQLPGQTKKMTTLSVVYNFKDKPVR